MIFIFFYKVGFRRKELRVRGSNYLDSNIIYYRYWGLFKIVWRYDLIVSFLILNLVLL